jgi:hypothetical protein
VLASRSESQGPALNRRNINSNAGGNQEMVGAAHPWRMIVSLVAFAITILVVIRGAEVLYHNNVDESAVFPSMVPFEALAALIVVALAVLVMRSNRRMQ